MSMRGQLRAWVGAWCNRGLALVVVAAALAFAPAGATAQNLTYSEAKLGILAHDVHFLKGKEHGVDINPEIIFASPVPDTFAAGLPWYVRFAAQPRPTVGGEINTAGYTNQVYFGATWTWELASNVLAPTDGITFGIFFGPSFNDGSIVSSKSDVKSLGSNVLFREGFELGYRVTPLIQVSAFLDHVSNAGLARYNQSINDFGGRIGVRF